MKLTSIAIGATALTLSACGGGDSGTPQTQTVSGVICAVVVPLAEPEPGTTECRTVLLSLLVAVSTQGRVLPLSVTE